MTYREIGISIRSAYSQGWPDDASRLAFRTETRKLFRDAGWQVEEMPLDSGHCDTVRNGKDVLYLHPTVLSGVMQEDHIPELQQLLSSAATFRVLGILFPLPRRFAYGYLECILFYHALSASAAILQPQYLQA